MDRAPAPGATSAPGTDNPQDTRTCRDCGQSKIVSPETWPYRNRGKGTPYQPHGFRCSACESERKKKYEKRRDDLAALVADVPSDPQRGQSEDKDKQREAVKASKLDVAKALKAGARALNEYAPSVLARVLEYADDPHHEHHIWALELLAQRILPRKLFEELGGQAAGVGSLNDKRPQFLIQVLPAQPEQPQGRVIEGNVETLEALPAPP